MNNLDFEKTQIWAKNVLDAPVPIAPIAAAAAPAIARPPAPAKKPVMKKLTKEEKIVLATGGALALGLGYIVISSLSNEDIVEKTPVPTTADLTAPVLDLGVPELVAKPEEPEIPKPHHAAPKPHLPRSEPPAAAQTPEHEIHHALLEIPDTPEVATKVGDELTFIEAFNVARDEVGPAGLFAWRDTYYSTFTDKEWESVPEDKKAQWLVAAEPIIDPGYENLSEGITPEAAPDHANSVVVAERGEITWTGIDKNGDGQAEILMARIHGQSPMVLLDTDGDGILDTRYDYDAASGKTFASVIEPFSMSVSDIEHLEYIPVEGDMSFFNHSGNEQTSESLPVSIYTENSQYVVSLDSNMDNKVDAITYLTDDRGPVVGLDFDNDGQIEMGYVYDSDSQTVNSIETEPMEEMSFDHEVPILSQVDDHFYQNEFAAEVLSYDDHEEKDPDPDADDDYFSTESDQQDDDMMS